MIPVTLMYHGVYGNAAERDRFTIEDRPYAVSARRLARHLDALRAANVRFVMPHEVDPGRPGVLLTFDDGDRGWFDHVLPLLRRRRIRALFFVTPTLIGRPGYCDWDHLRQLLKDGHMIGAHGLTHRFLPDLGALECRQELWQSRQQLERRLGVRVERMSFPGGRFGARELRLAREAGYRYCFTSLAGQRHDGFCQPRLAVRANTSHVWLTRMALGHTLPWAWLKTQDVAKHLARYLIGNKGYHELYRFVRNQAQSPKA